MSFKGINKKGITLISLVITIVIMLILATVSINLILGNNGIFNKSKVASNEMKYSNAEEKVANAVAASYNENGLDDNELKDNINKIDGLKNKIDTVKYDLEITVDGYKFKISSIGAVTGFDEDNSLPENTLDNPQDVGKEVALKDGWGIDTVKYVNTINGIEVTNIEKVATMYAVSVGDANTVPIPKNFYYVGGNLDTGVIISDDSDDKYDGKNDKTTFDYASRLKGNQFVWIPCTEEEYQKTSWGKSVNTNWDKETPNVEWIEIKKYGGFYIARYEAGLATTIEETKENQTHDGANQVYNLDGKPQSRAGQVPWIFIDSYHAKSNSKKMYENNNYVDSALITGTQFDVVLNKFISKGEATDSEIKTNSNLIGNYMKQNVTYTGRKSESEIINGKWIMYPFEDAKTNETITTNNTMFTTGASDKFEQYHIFDIGGNVWDFNDELANMPNGKTYMIRGGSYLQDGSQYQACYRNNNPDLGLTHTNLSIGFRVVLYMK